MSKFILPLLGILFALIFTPTYIVACGCPALDANLKKSVTDEYHKSALVFSGKVIEARWLPVTESNASGRRIRAEVLTLKFAIDKWWKGTNEKEIIWRTSETRYIDSNIGVSGSNCEYSFETGKTYLVYAEKSENRFTADVCGRTKVVGNSNQDIEERQILNEIRKNE